MNRRQQDQAAACDKAKNEMLKDIGIATPDDIPGQMVITDFMGDLR